MARIKRAPLAEWTILVFLNAKNNLEPFSFLNFKQMAKVGSTDKVNILVEFGRPVHHQPPGAPPQFGGWSKTLRFRVGKDMNPTEQAAVLDLGRTNMGAGESLTDFVSWARTAYPAKRTMLVIWDHGQGWRRQSQLTLRLDRAGLNKIARERSSARKRLAGRLGSLDPIPDDSQVHGSFRYVSTDDDTGDKLYNREIQDALTALTKEAKIDIISFDACLMAMLETAYALRDQGLVMVASEELEPGDGWSYDKFLRPLVANSDIDAAALGSLMVDAYREHYGDRDATTLSAVDLTKVKTLASAVSEFSATATRTLGTNLPALKKARNACENYAPTDGLHSIDLGRFLDQVIQTSGTSPTLASKADAARKALHNLVIANYASAQRQGRFGSEGLGIYFPRTQFDYDNDRDGAAYRPGNTYYPVEFVDKEKWVTFLHAYLEAI